MENIFEILKAILFGIVEGITEWLPISSTGHMILLNEFVKLDVSEEFWDMFLVVIQLGAILAVVVLFWNIIWPFGLSKNVHEFFSNNGDKGFWKQKHWIVGPIAVKMEIIINWLKIVVACIPAIVFVLLDLDDLCDQYFYNATGVSIALIVFGIAFILIENRNIGKHAKVEELMQITWKMAALIGIFQLLAAAFPGTSRSGATILGARILGLNKQSATEFSFFAAVPAILGASAIKIFEFSTFAIKSNIKLTANAYTILLIAFFTAFLISIISIKLLLGFIRKHSFIPFGIYRIILGITVLFML